VVEQGAEFSTLKFYLKPSFDFKQELLSYGSDVEVIKPEWLRREYYKNHPNHMRPSYPLGVTVTIAQVIVLTIFLVLRKTKMRRSVVL